METLLGSSYRVTMQVQWEAVFSMWSAPTLYHASDSTVSVPKDRPTLSSERAPPKDKTKIVKQ
jgi:hypothetical protein